MKKQTNRIDTKDLVEGFLFSLQADGKAVRTYEYYANNLQHFLNYVNDHNWPDKIHQIESQHIREFLAYVASRTYTHGAGNGTQITRHSKPSSAWPYFRTLRRLFNWAIEEGFLDSSPLATIHFKQPSEPQIQPYTVEELQRLLAVCELDMKTNAYFTGIRNKGMLLLFIDSATRLGEMVGLQINDVDLNNRILHILGKGNKKGIAPFSSITAKVLWNWEIQRKLRAKTNYFWITEEGNAFSIEGLKSWFKRLKVRAGVHSPGGIHRLRHTAALQYLRGTRDSFLLQLFLRHESLEMSRRYTQGLKQEEAIEAHRNGGSPVEGLGLG